MKFQLKLPRKHALIDILSRRPDFKFDPIYLEGINLFFSWRIALFVVALIAYKELPVNLPSHMHLATIWKIWFHLDTSWYNEIAIHGYTQSNQTAFFPAWPLLIRLTKIIFTQANTYILALITANILTLISLLLFTRLLKFDYKKPIIIWSLVYLCIFPMSFYLSIGYSEALFLTLVLATFVAARKNYWWLVGILGFFASATRPIGVLLIVPMLIGYFEYQKISLKSLKKIRWNIIFLLLMPLGLIAYQYFLLKTFNDLTAFIQAQSNWNRTLYNARIWPQLWSGLQYIFTERHLFSSEWLKQIVLYLFYILPILSTIYLIYKKKYAYASYVLLSSLLPISTGLLSFPRFLVPLFPIYIVLAEISDRLPKFRYYLISLSVGLLVLYLCMYVNGFWVA